MCVQISELISVQLAATSSEWLYDQRELRLPLNLLRKTIKCNETQSWQFFLKMAWKGFPQSLCYIKTYLGHFVMFKENTCLEAVQGYWSEYSAQLYNLLCSSFTDILQGNPSNAMETNNKNISTGLIVNSSRMTSKTCHIGSYVPLNVLFLLILEFFLIE